MLGPVTGRRMARYITTGEPDDIITSLSLDRFENGDLKRGRLRGGLTGRSDQDRPGPCPVPRSRT